jgi:hypothetical protein
MPRVTPPPMVAAGGGEACPSCSASMAPDQRYCLSCGSRRGEPRLPFMDAVVFMEAMRPPPASAAPPAASERRPRVSANASLVAGVATLVLAIGVGVLIGRSGDSGAAPTAAATPQVIKVEGGGGNAAIAAPTSGKATKTGGSGGGSKTAAKAKAETGSSGTSKAAEEVLKPAGDVELPPPTTQVGEDCEKGTAGCSDSGEFNGSFFGE